MTARDTAQRTSTEVWLRPRALGLWTLAAMVIACGPAPSTPPPDRDGGVDADAGLATTPDIPWLDEGRPPIAPPLFTPCPDGWHEVSGGGGEDSVVTCHPYATDARGERNPDECPDGWVHFVGDVGCTPVGDPCPTGDFAEGLPTDATVIYVLEAAPTGGDGSRETPLRTITEAMARAWPGTVIAIGKGEYDEALRPRAGVTLWGACASETGLTPSSPGRFEEAAITIRTAGVALRNIRVGPSALPGVWALGADASVSIDGVIIQDTVELGLVAALGARVEGREVVISDTRPDSTGEFGRGVAVESAGMMNLARVVLPRNHDVSVFAGGEGVSLILSDVLIIDTQATDGAGGQGIGVEFGATAKVTGALILRNRSAGVMSGNGSSVTLSNLVVHGTEERGRDGTGGVGLSVASGATVAVSRAVLSENRQTGLFVEGENSSVTFSDIVVRDNPGRRDGTFGRGIGVQSGGSVEGRRALLLRNRDIGVHASDAGTTVTLFDLVVADTQERRVDETGGRGMNVQYGASTVVTRALFSHNRDIGVIGSEEGTSITLLDVAVEGTQARQSDETRGRGLGVQTGARAEVRRALFTQNHEFGVLSITGGSSVALADVVVAGTNEQACASTTCSDRPFGVGIGAFDASLSMTRFEVRDSALCGVLLADQGQMDLMAGQVSGSPIGACLQVDGYPTSRLTDGVRYVDNDMNIATTSLPVPYLAGAGP